MFGCEMGIAEGHLQIGMAHKFPNGVEIDAGHDQIGGKRMAEVMPSKFLDLGNAQDLPPSGVHIVEGLSILSRED